MKSEGYKQFGLGNLVHRRVLWERGENQQTAENHGWRLIKRKEKPFNVK